MNDVLSLSGKLHHRPNPSGGGGSPTIPKGKSVNRKKIEDIKADLERVLAYWKKQKLGIKPLASVYYSCIIAKSNRIVSLLSERGRKPNESVVGAKFTDDKSPKHIITYCIDIECIEETIKKLDKCLYVVGKVFGEIVTYDNLSELHKGEYSSKIEKKYKNHFAQIIKDIFYIERIGLPFESISDSINTTEIVSLYDTGLSFSELILKLGLRVDFDRIDDTTWNLNQEQYAELYKIAPYLISMSVSDFRLEKEIIPTKKISMSPEIPKPTNEPVIGVIDTLFDTSVYFSDWVEYEEYVSADIPHGQGDSSHGTAVSSLIVDGPALNPNLDDGCGRFRVKHFGVAVEGKNSSVQIIKDIKQIVLSNKDIKVWNLSLGSSHEIRRNSISPEAALLDELQFENDIIFVIVGTNKEKSCSRQYPLIGSPADSLNSIVVNSISFDEKPPIYARTGPVLCFFNKPDVCAYGGDEQDGIAVYSSYGYEKKQGTSFATPWIARKIAFLIYVMKLPREVAKALLIDSAAGWSTDISKQNILGFGRVPTHIKDILKTRKDEIKFYIHGTTEKYETYAYNIPLPMVQDKFPYIAKATLCYFPECSKKQGVDYTNTELDIHFGRVKNKAIKSIDNNIQGEPECIAMYEEEARRLFRKWDNVKHITEGIKEKNIPKKSYEITSFNPTGKPIKSEFWGISIKAKERLQSHSEKGVNFGLVITLREITGVNRIETFIHDCIANNWDVQSLDIDAMLRIHAIENEEIVFEE